MTILRLLGHRWPRQIEPGEPVPDWADADGIIPLSEGTEQATLYQWSGGPIQIMPNKQISKGKPRR